MTVQHVVIANMFLCFSNLQAMMSIIRASVGIGMLAMPLAYRNAGTFVSTSEYCVFGS